MKQTSTKLVFDLEANNLLLDATEIYCGVTYNLDTKEFKEYRPSDIASLIKDLMEADTLIGHNIIGYDLPLIKKLHNVEYKGNIIDTLLLSKLVYYNKDSSFKHSLDEWGKRLKEYKGSYNDWSKFTEDMLKYNKQDVIVNTKLYKHLTRVGKWLPKRALDIEQDLQKIIVEQHLNGWEFDIEAAKKLHIELVGEEEEALDQLMTVFKPQFIAKGPVKTPKKQFTRLGVTTVGTHQPIALTTFNPGSGKHIYTWITRLYGEQKWMYTEKNTPKTDADSLEKMFSDKEWSKPLLHYIEVKKLLGMLADGGKAWLKLVHKDGRIHGQVDILGTNTGRTSANSPNMQQIPSGRAYKGKEARSLFKVKDGYKLLGCDASGLELRTLAHYLAKYDNGEYGKAILEGDIHTANQKAAGLPTRDNAKTFIYGFLYGAGNEKIGTIVKGTAKDGKRLKETFLKKTPGLDKLVSGVKKAASRGYLIGISGRRLHVRSPHSALNLLLQSAGAYIMKYYVVQLYNNLQHLDFKLVGFIHDEVQIEIREDQAEEGARIAEDTFRQVTEQLNWRCLLEGEAKIGRTWNDTH